MERDLPPFRAIGGWASIGLICQESSRGTRGRRRVWGRTDDYAKREQRTVDGILRSDC